MNMHIGWRFLAAAIFNSVRSFSGNGLTINVDNVFMEMIYTNECFAVKRKSDKIPVVTGTYWGSKAVCW